MRQKRYWPVGQRGCHYSGMDHAEVLQADNPRRAMLQAVYNRYADRWNQVEGNHALPLDLHEHRICGLPIFGGGSRNVVLLLWGEDLVIEICGNLKKSWAPGWSFKRRPLLQTDLRRMSVHFRSPATVATFDAWLQEEIKTYAQDNRYASVKVYLQETKQSAPLRLT